MSKQKTDFYLTVVEEPSNAIRCEINTIVESFFTAALLYMPLKDKCFSHIMPSLFVLKVSLPYKPCRRKICDQEHGT